MCPDFCIYLVGFKSFCKSISGEGMVMPGHKAPLNHVSLSSDIPNKGD